MTIHKGEERKRGRLKNDSEEKTKIAEKWKRKRTGLKTHVEAMTNIEERRSEQKEI